MQSRYSNCITELATDMPRSFSIAIQSEVAYLPLLRALTVPAAWIAPPNNNSFSVRVVLPASGWEIIANVRRRATSGVVGEVDRSNSMRRVVLRGVAGLPLTNCAAGPWITQGVARQAAGTQFRGHTGCCSFARPHRPLLLICATTQVATGGAF